MSEVLISVHICDKADPGRYRQIDRTVQSADIHVIANALNLLLVDKFPEGEPTNVDVNRP